LKGSVGLTQLADTLLRKSVTDPARHRHQAQRSGGGL
jgi:hypothetical protein